MKSASRSGMLEPRHVSSLRRRLMSALAVGWALGGCGGEALTEEDSPGEGEAPPPQPVAVVPPAAEPRPASPPEAEPQPSSPPASASCNFGYAGEKCYAVEILDEYAREGSSSMRPVYTAEGCVDSTTATFAVAFGCAAFPVGSGERRGGECCYHHCNTSPGCGRPFVVAGAARVAEPRASLEWSGSNDVPSCLDAQVADAIGQEWLRDALAEHASIGAFSAFSLSLLALGAPEELVRASAAATLDEVFHARECFALASYYANRPLGPAPLDIADLRVATDLITVVERAFIDGCIGETAAALVARASLDVCASPRAAAALVRIAEDEARHAEVAWQFVAWALRRGGDAVADVLSRALERSAAGLACGECRTSAAAPPEWHRAGRLSDAERAHITERALRDVVRPTLAAMLERQRSDRGVRSAAAPPA